MFRYTPHSIFFIAPQKIPNFYNNYYSYYKIFSLLGSSQFSVEDGCLCPEQVVVYECTINGSGIATIWKGSAMDCPENSNSITLLHSQFANGMASGYCNNGAMVGQGVPPRGDSINVFTSQLRVTVNLNLYGKTIECAVDNGITSTTLRRTMIELTKGNNSKNYLRYMRYNIIR